MSVEVLAVEHVGIVVEESDLVERIVDADLVEIVGFEVEAYGPVQTVVAVADIGRDLFQGGLFAARTLALNKLTIARTSRYKNSTFS